MAQMLEDIRLALGEARTELMSKPNVIATGVGYKTTNGKITEDLALVCSVASKSDVKSDRKSVV